MKVPPIRYCADIEASRRFYLALGSELGVTGVGGPPAARAWSRPPAVRS